MSAISQMNAESPGLGCPGISDTSISSAIKHSVNIIRVVSDKLVTE
jgi:hypothetical protein